MKFNLSRTLMIGSILAGVVACDRKPEAVTETPPANPVARTKTLETAGLKSAIDRYEQAPTAENAADVKKAFADLDAEIAELEADVARETGEDRAEAAQKLANLTAYQAAERARFNKVAPTAPVLRSADGRSGLQKAEDAAHRTGEALKDAAKETGSAIRDAVR